LADPKDACSTNQPQQVGEEGPAAETTLDGRAPLDGSIRRAIIHPRSLLFYSEADRRDVRQPIASSEWSVAFAPTTLALCQEISPRTASAAIKRAD
jgi:hypothetical protein